MLKFVKRSIIYGKNSIYVLAKRIYTRNKVHLQWKQLFHWSLSIRATKSGTVSVGKLMSNRGHQIILADGGCIHIGNECFFNDGCSITSLNLIEIGDNCTFGNNAIVIDHDHDYRNGKGFISGKVIIGNNVWVGANVVILKDVIVGENSVIAAGTVVRKGCYPANSLIHSEINTTIINIGLR